MGLVILMMNTTIRTYSELSQFSNFKDRYEYLRLRGRVGEDTFGHQRYLNQIFYKTAEWKRLRNYIITRDKGCDLGIEGHEISNTQKIYIHHMNPITIEDIENRSVYAWDPEYLITTIHTTHNAIHYGDASLLTIEPIVRFENDTCPWKL